jgi:hypothetical protein
MDAILPFLQRLQTFQLALPRLYYDDGQPYQVACEFSIKIRQSILCIFDAQTSLRTFHHRRGILVCVIDVNGGPGGEPHHAEGLVHPNFVVQKKRNWF